MAGQRELAREVRTGLTVVEGNKGKAVKINKLDELWYRKPVRQHVKEFAALFSIIFLVIAGAQIYFGKPSVWPMFLISAAIIFTFLGYKAPFLLRPVWSGWMKFAHVLGIVMTTLILFLAWAIVLLPIAYLLRFIRIKVMDMDFKTNVSTYWEEREDKHNDFKLLERQF